MFTGTVVWRGLIYTLLMAFGKMTCGLWLIRFTVPFPKKIHPRHLSHFLPSTNHFWGRGSPVACPLTDQASAQVGELQDHNPAGSITKQKQENRESHATTTKAADQIIPPTPSPHFSASPSKPLSLYPASILGFAMVSRGEIGFLVSSLADGNGIFSTGGDDDIFLIVTWAIVLCTVIGPIGVGLLVKRLKRLEMAKENGGGGRDVLGVWGVR